MFSIFRKPKDIVLVRHEFNIMSEEQQDALNVVRRKDYEFRKAIHEYNKKYNDYYV